jgi:tetratricopeptide (TPR) repeat protein
MTTILNKEKILEQARIYVDEGKFDKAISEYEKILIADPSDLRVKLRVAELYTKRKQIADAIRLYREVASAYSAEGFYLKAVTVLKNILRLNPTLLDVNQMLADLYERMGLTNDAIRQYNILATTFDQKGDGEKALEVRKKIVDLDSSSETARIKLAEIYQRQGMEDQAVDQYEALARLYEERGNKRERLAEMYEKILTHRENVEMLRELCRIYDSLGEKKKALKWVEKSKETAENDPELLAMQARIYASLNQIETARSKYLALADLLRNAGRPDEALSAYAEILLLIPGEDEKIYKRAEDLGENAIEEIKAIVAKRRKELALAEALTEEEKLKEKERQLVEPLKRKEGEKERREEAKKPEEPKRVSVTPRKPSPPAAPSPPRGREILEPKPLQEEIKAQPPSPVAKEIMEKEADVAYQLGQAYWRINLLDESKIELEKAARLYSEILMFDKEDAKGRQRFDEIEILLKGKKETAKVVQPPPASKPQKKAEPTLRITKKEKPSTETQEEPPKKEPEPETKKKKISFV